MANGSNPSMPKRVWLPLHVLDTSGKIVTKLKFQKFTFLIQNDAKITDHYNFKKWYYGPYCQELDLDSKTLNNVGYINRELVSGHEHPYWIFDICKNGHDYLEDIQSKRKTRYINRVNRAIENYKDMDHNEIVEYVYERYGLSKRHDLNKKINETINTLFSLIAYFDGIFHPDYEIFYDVLSFSEYCLSAIEKSRKENNLIKAILLNSTNELAYNFTEVANICNNELIKSSKIRKIVCESSDPDFYEIFNFIEYFCVKNDIMPKISEVDFSDFITEEEIINLEESLRTGWNS